MKRVRDRRYYNYPVKRKNELRYNISDLIVNKG